MDELVCSVLASITELIQAEIEYNRFKAKLADSDDSKRLACVSAGLEESLDIISQFSDRYFMYVSSLRVKKGGNNA